MARRGEIDLRVDLRDVQLLLHGDDELVAQRLVQLEGARRAQEERVGPVHPQQGGAGAGSSPLQAAQYGLRHGDIRLGTRQFTHVNEVCQSLGS
jgi:hypothetical protein